MTLLRLAPLVLIAAVASGLIWKTMPAGTAPVAGPDPIAALIPAEIFVETVHGFAAGIAVRPE